MLLGLIEQAEPEAKEAEQDEREGAGGEQAPRR
jgi:hypothetical protein